MFGYEMLTWTLLRYHTIPSMYYIASLKFKKSEFQNTFGPSGPYIELVDLVYIFCLKRYAVYIYVILTLISSVLVSLYGHSYFLIISN